MNLEKLYKYLFIGVAVALLGFIGKSVYDKNQQDKVVAELQNNIAARDVTIETQKDVYHKLTIQSENLQKLLDTKDGEVSRLVGELKKSHEKLLTANSLALSWKRAYEAEVAGNQTDVPGENGIVRKRVDFEKDFGYIGVKGFTLTDPPEATVRVQQNRPLKISLVVSQDEKGAWHTRASSSEENVGVDVELAAVNPMVLAPRWYEGIGLTLDMGMGSQFLAGAGVTYKFGKFEVGPRAWFTLSTAGPTAGWAVGLQALWHPFAK